mgnify:FL=1|jgi:hypothetical protein
MIFRKKRMKKYLLLVENEKLWEKFKLSIKKDINSEILDLIRKKVGDNISRGQKNE